MEARSISEEFKEQSIQDMLENGPRIKKCMNELSEEEIWKRPNESSNSVGNLILHLCGNMTQYIISSLGGKKDLRERDSEFAARTGYSKEELLTKLESTVDQCVNVIKGLSEEQLLQERSVQGFEYSGIGNIIHVVEHYSYHTGQIAFWTKLLRDQDLGFYTGFDLNKKNEK
jgi:uncharacterized damage-inducible protein DinB